MSSRAKWLGQVARNDNISVERPVELTEKTVPHYNSDKEPDDSARSVLFNAWNHGYYTQPIL